MSCDVMCRADVLWVLYAVSGCVLCMVCAVCVLYYAIFTVQPETHSELIPAARKIEFESCK